MLSDLQKRKIGHQFTMLDLNGDGFLSDADVDLIVNNLALPLDHREPIPLCARCHLW